MNFEEALTAELSSLPGLADKVYPLNAPEGTPAPYIIYVSSEGLQDKSLKGYHSSKEVPCEINIFTDSYAGLKDLTQQVITKLVSFQSRNIGHSGPFIQNFTYEKPVELYENQVSLYRCLIEGIFKF
ncbi:hypothetical protein AM500_21385 [Bacillus sp. FJAT-18017]|uniref:DUF3168 domain-containing protein n=1 Tax=Bacillus sp. FJAT-18017 TaxID=1705566 RepID=UPI0006AF28D1|nr:DUF3168 domain-containing protein [Bacillus sp. FJAT-18017]ALC92062.1 hypothetical protein AM500_21385 [Bacillus sp. FJAT-18017]